MAPNNPQASGVPILDRRVGPWRFLDLAAASLLLILTFAICFRATHWNPSFYNQKSARDIWFDGDVQRVFSIETDRWGYNDRTALHPLFPFIAFPPIYATMKITKITPVTASSLFHSLIAGLWVAAFYLLLRRFRLKRLDSVIFSAVAATSATAMAWFPTPETFVMGSLSMFPALFIAGGRSPGKPWQFLVASLSSFGVTASNWMASFFGMVLDLNWKTIAKITVITVVTGMGFGVLHDIVFPHSARLGQSAKNEWAWVLTPGSGGPWAILRTFFFTGMTAPEFHFMSNWRQPVWPTLTLQTSGLMTGTRWSWMATPIWALLLLVGAFSFRRMRGHRRLKTVLVMTLLYQLLLHMLYGRETFLYSMHYVPLLVLIAALSSLTYLRPLVLVLAATLAVTNAMNNAAQISWAFGYAGRYEAMEKVEDMPGMRINQRGLKRNPELDYRFWHEFPGWKPPVGAPPAPAPASSPE